MRDGAFNWAREASVAFELIKEKLTTTPILVLPEFETTFEILCDVSKIGIEAVLIQKGHPVAYYSEKLDGACGRHFT